MHLERVAPVLELVAVRVGVPRQLARLAHGHEPRAQRERDRRREDEPACLDADDLGDRAVERRHQQLGRAPERLGVTEQRRDVLEHHPGLREVVDVADVLPEILGRHGIGS